ncbi:hypothetical protein [Achromobacter sp. KK8]
MDRFAWQFQAGFRLDGCVPPSWNGVLFELMFAIEDVLSDEERQRFWWTDIKEKRGELRAYYVNNNAVDKEQEVASLIDRAENLVNAIVPKEGNALFSHRATRSRR